MTSFTSRLRRLRSSSSSSADSALSSLRKESLETTAMSSGATDSSFCLTPNTPIYQGETPRSILKIKTQTTSLATDIISPYYQRRQRFQKRKRVLFSEVHLQIFPRCLGDNPSVRDGLPLALDYSATPAVAAERLDDYERQRHQERKINKESLRLSKKDRQLELEALSYEKSELRRCELNVRMQQSQRGWTSRTRGLQPVQETLELASKAVANVTWNRRQKQREQKWLSAYYCQMHALVHNEHECAAMTVCS